MLGRSPLQSEQEHDRGRGEQRKACQIKLWNDATEQGEGERWFECLIWDVREEQEQSGYCTDGEIDVEA